MKGVIVHHEYFAKNSSDYRLPYELERTIRAEQGDEAARTFRYSWRSQIDSVQPASATLYDTTCRWMDAGQHVYVLPYHIQDAFAETSLNDIESTHIQSPYPAFYLALPDSNLTLKSYSLSDSLQSYKVIGAYVAVGQLERGDWGTPIESHSTGLFSSQAVEVFNVETGETVYDTEGTRPGIVTEQDKAVAIDALSDLTQERFIRVVLVAIKSLHTFKQDDDCCFMVTVPLSRFDDGTMERVLSNMCAELGETSDFWTASDPRELKDHNAGVAHLVTRMALNLMLYMRQRNPIISRFNPETARPKLERTARKSGKRHRIAAAKARSMLSTLPSVPATIIGTFRSRPSATANGTGSPKDVHWRAGHWHSYWYGPRTTPDGSKQKGDSCEKRWVHPIIVNEERGKPKPKRYHVTPDVDADGRAI